MLILTKHYYSPVSLLHWICIAFLVLLILPKEFSIFLAVSCSHKSICPLCYLSSDLFIFHWYFLLLWWDMAQSTQKRISGLLMLLFTLRFYDFYGSVNDHWNTVGLQEKKKLNKTADKEISFMLDWLFSKSSEAVANHFGKKGEKTRELCSWGFNTKYCSVSFSVR